MDPITEKEYQIAHFINRASINTPIQDLIDEIESESGFRLDYSKFYNFRKNSPKVKIKELQNGRKRDF